MARYLASGLLFLYGGDIRITTWGPAPETMGFGGRPVDLARRGKTTHGTGGKFYVLVWPM